MRYQLVKVLFVSLLMTAVAIQAQETGKAPEAAKVVAFEQRGVLVDIQHFFATATTVPMPEGVVAGDIASGRALVTDDGIYAFLETPANAGILQPIAVGTVVTVAGKLLRQGRLVAIEKITLTINAPVLDVILFSKDAGAAITLTGRNMCQCGLSVDSLPKTCVLGHLHHLQAPDGAIYHYLQTKTAQALFLGTNSHFKTVKLKGRLLPGQYLLVDSYEVM